MRLSRFALFAVSILVAGNAFAAADIFLQIPGVVGGSSSKGHEGWSDVQAHSLNLLPAVLTDKKTFASQCSAVINILLGEGAPTTAQLVGIPLVGDILIEAVRPETGQTFYRAALKGALISGYSTAQFDTFRAEIKVSFQRVALTVWPQGADGRPGPPENGIFDCTRP